MNQADPIHADPDQALNPNTDLNTAGMTYSQLIIRGTGYGTAESYVMQGWSHSIVGSRQRGIVNPTYPTQSTVPM